jgi:hypothetical protein
VQVAPRYFMRCRGEKPQESRVRSSVPSRRVRENGRSGPGHTLEQREVHERMRRELIGS